MKQKIQTLVVGFAIILAAAVQTEVNQKLKMKQLKAAHPLAVTSQLR